MEPVEINAGNWYLLAEDPEAWAADTGYHWSVREATTAAVEATVQLRPDGTLTGTAEPGGSAALAAGSAAVRRFAEGAWGMTVTERP
ncbi:MULTISPECIES: hypothetical protein [Rhodococcus]|uniref:hypothetical protein n=1 Tax=Rhodococcus TaxID=1827 RepID=UPI00065F99AF|nr:MULTISPECIES: hypothetical protein [Rhodococcus]MDO2378319.1 hypothetical protein [Rhodococcus ruber]NGR06351.1 hypothetical protein [bacterium SGD-2]ATQ28482.1 hypothetical protein CS378_06930 [Rhodococcus ruber]AUM17506.1 hypothetical protein CSW53_13860 [Rhodococcus ruber]MCF8782018.1 hypothetical protein [Rhodococcus ruber]